MPTEITPAVLVVEVPALDELRGRLDELTAVVADTRDELAEVRLVLIDLYNAANRTNTERAAAMTEALDQIRAELTENRDVVDAIEVLVTDLLDRVEANLEDPAEVQAIVDEIRGQRSDLAAAIVAGTPAEPDAGEPPAIETFTTGAPGDEEAPGMDPAPTDVGPPSSGPA